MNIKLSYTCPTCGEECETYAESMEEISVWCETCQEDITGEFDVYADYMGSLIDYAHDRMEDR